MEVPATVPTKIASPPFANKSTADIIFRTSDGVHFYAHKIVLSLASAFFEGMFSISQPSPSGEAQEMLDGIPMVEVAEDSATMDCVLRYCYPVPDPVLTDLELLDRVLGAVIKYALDEAIGLATAALRAQVANSPLQVYAISSRHKLLDEIVLAAKSWKGRNLAMQPRDILFNSFEETHLDLCHHPMMDALPATTYYRLLRFVQQSSEDITRLGKLFRTTPTESNIPRGLDSYPFDLAGADIILLSIDNVKFPVHRIMIEAHIACNATFPLQALLIPNIPEGEDEHGRPLLRTGERADVLQILLLLCYPARSEDGVGKWTDAQCRTRLSVDIVAAAQRYGMSSIVSAYMDRLTVAIPQYPLDMYCISVMFGWHSQAYSAALFMANHTYLPSQAASWLDIISVKEYHHLLRFWHSCQSAMIVALVGFVPTVRKVGQLFQWYHCAKSDGKRRVLASIVPLVEQELALGTAMNAPSASPEAELPSRSMQLVERSLELQAKLDEAVASVDFRLSV